MPRDALKGHVFAGDDRLYGHVLDDLAAAGRVVIHGEFAHLSEFAPQRSPGDAAVAAAIEEAYRRGRYTPPGRDDVLAQAIDPSAGERMFQALLDEGILVDLGGGVIFHGGVLAEIEARVIAYIREHGEITVASLRDHLGSSRKFALTVLEYFDTRHLTRRVGDKRVLTQPSVLS